MTMPTPYRNERVESIRADFKERMEAKQTPVSTGKRPPLDLTEQSPEQKALSMMLAANRGIKDDRSMEQRAARKPNAVQYRDSEVYGLVGDRLPTPFVPTREQATAQGVKQPSLNGFLLSIGQMPIIHGVEFPDQPDSVHKIAYELLPAFMDEFGDSYAQRFNVRPAFLVRMWINSLDEGDEMTGVKPWQLQAVVYEMAKELKPFNPRNMAAVAAELRNTDKLADQQRQLKWSQRNPYFYEFFPAMNPDTTKVIVSNPTPWAARAGYPKLFPVDCKPTPRQLYVIDALVYERRRSETTLCDECARWLAGTMIQVVQATLREKGTRITEMHLLDLAYRFSAEYILRTHSHTDPIHRNLRSGLLYPPTALQE